MAKNSTGGTSSPGWRAEATEALATLREAVLLARDLAPVLPHVQHGDDIVVLIHGIFASAGVFRPLRRHIEKVTGARVASFTHLPGVGVRRIALSLAKMVDRIPRSARVHIVGHSMGGLIARWYVDELGGHSRVVQTISLASPFGGAPAAQRFPFLVGNDLAPASELLESLREKARPEVPHLSIVGTADRLVFPQARATFAHGDSVVLEGRGHNSLLYDTEVARLVVERILQARARHVAETSRVEMPAALDGPDANENGAAPRHSGFTLGPDADADDEDDATDAA